MDVMTRTEVAIRYPTPALEKGLDALELLASESEGLTKTEVARRLGRTVSEVFRMLVCLEIRGYIARSGNNDRYSLTLHLFKLAYQHHAARHASNHAIVPFGSARRRSGCNRRPGEFSAQQWLLHKGRWHWRPYAFDNGTGNLGISAPGNLLADYKALV
jgi:hypothetical protein